MGGLKVPLLIVLILLIAGISLLFISKSLNNNKTSNDQADSTDNSINLNYETSMPIPEDYSLCIINKDVDDGETNENNKVANRFNLTEVISVEPATSTIILSDNNTPKTWTLDETYRRSIVVIHDLEGVRNGVGSASQILSKEENLKIPQFLSLLKPGDLAEVSDLTGITIACLNNQIK